MKKVKYFAALLVVALFARNANAQENTFRVDDINYDSVEVKSSLSDSDVKQFENIVIQTVRKFNFNLVKLWQERDERKYTLQEFDTYRKDVQLKTLELFIGKGEQYYSNDTVGYKVSGYEEGKAYYMKNDKKLFCDNIKKDNKGVMRAYVYEQVYHEAPQMETTSANTSKKTRKAMNLYIRGLRPRNGTVVRANFGGYQMVEKLHKIGDGLYQGSVSYYQEYRTYSAEGKKRYGDCTYKTMQIYLKLEEIELGGEKYKTWHVLLGDVQATETKKI